jgi:hypothetical protein
MGRENFGAWILIWILGAPLLLGLLEVMCTPKVTTRSHGRSPVDERTYPSAASTGMGLGSGAVRPVQP